MGNHCNSKTRLIIAFFFLIALLLPVHSTVAQPAPLPFVPNFVYHPLITGYHDPMSVSSTDLDKDGDKDILASGHAQEMLWFENDGNQNFTKHVIAWMGGHAITAADLDNDGDNDIFFVQCGGGSSVYWLENNGSQNFTVHLITRYVNYDTICPSPPEPNKAHAGDIDGNGYLDIVISASHTYCGVISWFENNGGTFTRHDLTDTFMNATDAWFVDLDQDGNLDILGAGANIGQIAWWKNNGNEQFSMYILANSFGASSIFPGDMDNDHDLDILGSDIYTGEMAWWENDGSQSFVKHSIASQFTTPNTILATDINNDGFMDILGVSWSLNEVAFWVNHGNQNFSKNVVSSSFIEGTSIFADDIDKDGDVDILGTAASDVVAWWEQNNAPVANIGPITANGEGSSVVFDGSGSSDPDGDPLTYAWQFGDGATGNEANPSHTYVDNGVYEVCLTVTDTVGNTNTECTNVEIANIAPSVTVVGGTTAEGGTFTGNGSFTDPGADTWTATVDYDDGSGAQPLALAGKSFNLYKSYVDNGLFAVEVCVTDDDGGKGCQPTTVIVNNVAPTVGIIAVDSTLVPVGTAINTTTSITDPGVLDTHTAVWDRGDGSTSAGTVTEANGSGSVSGSHVYATPGVYTIGLTVTDKDGGVGTSTYQYVVVYDPNGGFVTGGGWIWSPLGAYVANPSLEGKANFGFVSKYQKGANVPTGTTEFQFKAGDLNFHSTCYQWLVVAGAKAQFKGVGTINGSGEYGFILTAVDGQVNGGGGLDKFRIKIWDKATGEVVYDNMIGADDAALPTTLLGGGSIVIHTK